MIARYLVLAAVCLGACGDSSPPRDPCVTIGLGTRDLQFNAFGQLTGVTYPLEPRFDGMLPERLLIELYDSTTEGLAALAPGSYDLAAAPDDDLATCQHCVWVPIDWDGVAP